MNNPQSRRSLAPVVVGIAFTAAFLAFLGYIANQRRNAEERAPPRLVIELPRSGAVVDSPLVVRFSSRKPIERQQSGWGSGQFHLHARIGGVQHMPAIDEIRPVDGGYEWSLPGVRRGTSQLTLGWADRSHRELPDRSADTVTITIR